MFHMTIAQKHQINVEAGDDDSKAQKPQHTE